MASSTPGEQAGPSVWAPPPAVVPAASNVAPAATAAAPVPAPAPVPVAPIVPAAPIVPGRPGTTPPNTVSAAGPAMSVTQQGTAPARPSQPVVSPPVVAKPIVATPAAPVVGGAPAGKKKSAEDAASKGKFRETLWFKKGELDAAAAQVAAAEAAKGKDVADKADTLPIDERYKDDGTISRSDKEKYSLRTGATQMMASVKDNPAASRGGVSEDALIGEMKSGRRTILIAIVLGIIFVALLILLFTQT
jgi:hypothetical protein